MVRQDLVLEGKCSDYIRCAHGDKVLYPVAQLELKVHILP